MSFFSTKNVLFLAFFMGLTVLNNQVLSQNCASFFGSTGEPVDGLSINLCSPNPGVVELDANVTGSTPATGYAWSTGSASAKEMITSGGVYSVTISSAGVASACVLDFVVTTKQNPVPNLGSDEPYCEGSNYTKVLNPGSFSKYAWSDGTTAKILGINAEGTYKVTVTDVSGCVNSDDIIITENPMPVVDLGLDVTFCEDESVSQPIDASTQLTTNTFDFLWNTGETTGQITATNFGKHSVVVTDQLTNCFASSEMEIIPMQKAEPNLGADGIVCDGQLVGLDPQVIIPGYDYTWSNGAKTSTIDIFETGLYWVRLDAKNGTCMGLTDSATYTEGVLPIVNLGVDQYVCEGQNVTLLDEASAFPGATYIWQDGTIEKSIVATETGTYEVQVSNLCGTVVDQVFIEFQDCGNVYIPTSFTPNGDGKNEVFLPLTAQEFKEYGFWVYDRWGALLFKTNQPNVGWNGTVDGRLMSPGLYVWRVSYVSSFNEFGARIEKTGEFTLLK